MKVPAHPQPSRKAQATVEELRAAYDRVYKNKGISFYEACTHPMYRATLELGAAIARRPRPARIDHKALQARNDD